ncbi:CAP domain-containing protein [Streptomyces sp. NPDC054833]
MLAISASLAAGAAALPSSAFAASPEQHTGVANTPSTVRNLPADWPVVGAEQCGPYVDVAPRNLSYRTGPGGRYQNPAITNARVMEAVVCLINAQRAAYQPSLRWLPNDPRALQSAAHLHAVQSVQSKFWPLDDDDAKANTWKSPHVNPFTKSTIESRIQDSGWCSKRQTSTGEIAYNGWGDGATPRAAVKWWMNSDGHRDKILSPDFTAMGVWAEWGSPVQQKSDFTGGTYVVDFGQCFRKLGKVTR